MCSSLESDGIARSLILFPCCLRPSECSSDLESLLNYRRMYKYIYIIRPSARAYTHSRITCFGCAHRHVRIIYIYINIYNIYRYMYIIYICILYIFSTMHNSYTYNIIDVYIPIKEY